MADTVDHGSVVATVTVCARNAHVNLTVGTAARQSKMRVLWVTPLRMRDRLAGRALMGGSVSPHRGRHRILRAQAGEPRPEDIDSGDSDALTAHGDGNNDLPAAGLPDMAP